MLVEAMRPERAHHWDSGDNGGGSASLASDELLDQMDVPAAVVCLSCGSEDCMGCEPMAQRSKIIALVPWERRGIPFASRLWQTATAATCDAETFFSTLSDGSLLSALSFAIVAELAAATGVIALVSLPLFLFSRLGLGDIFHGGRLPRMAMVLLALSLPALSAMLVGAHAAHGMALGVGALRGGARSAWRRALRFGLYATGWDLILGPWGFLWLLWQEGFSRAIKLLRGAVGLPGRSSRAFVHGCLGLAGERARWALRASFFTAAFVTVVSAITIAGTLLIVALRFWSL